MTSKLDIIVPVYNEAENVSLLLQRISSSLKEAKIPYHVYFVDDRSTDDTVDALNKLKKSYPITVLEKKGTQGKAYSILESVPETTAPFLAMIDADLQYPPEVIPDMLKIADVEGMAVAKRHDNHEQYVRKMLSRGFRWFFGKILHGLDCDVQSGLKVFKREIIEQLSIDEVTPWTLDIPLLTNTLNLGYSIGEVSITFAKRNTGESKIKFVSSIREIGGQAIKYKFTQKRPFIIAPTNKKSMIGAGLVHKGKRFITHTTLQADSSALDVVTINQQVFILSLLLLLLLSFILLPLGTAKVVVGIMSFIYFMDVIFNFYLILKSLHNPPEIVVSKEELAELKAKDLPIYTILCPLYKEAHVIPQFLESISKIDWPKNKLDVQLLLEEDDVESVQAVKKMKLPKYVRMVVVPDSQPKTKPKACNYGLSLAQGEYVVIYDAEDDPDPLQLKKSYIAFQKVGPQIKCLQAKLNYYNPHQNWLTRLFTAEYSLWFDVILTGMQSIETTIPLGGTSNHFRTVDLLELQGWDPFNVTEDADLGVRLFSKGYKTAIIESTTLEEANSDFRNWLRQRSRWIKGYMQTYLLHMRDPIELSKKQGIHALLFQLTVGGKITFILINPILWLLTISYFTLYAYVGPAIEALYPSIIFYMAVISLIFGNFMFIYYYMIGAAKRENWTLMKWIFLVPLYWLMVSIAGAIGLYQLIVKPHYWEKTIHGLHLKAKEEIEDVVEDVEEAVAEVKEEVEDTSKLVLVSMISQIKELARLSLNKPFNFTSSARFADFKELAISIKSKKKWQTLFYDLVKGKYKSGFILVVATMAANIMNMLTNVYLGRELDVQDFAIFTIYSSILSIVGLFTSALSSTVNQKAANIFGKLNQLSILPFWVRIKNKTIIYSLVLSVLWFILVPYLSEFFQLDTIIPLLLFTPIILFSSLKSVNTGYLRGLLAFQLLAIITISEAIIRLLASVFFGELGMESYAYISIPISVITISLLSFFFIKIEKISKNKLASLKKVDYKLHKKFFALALVSNLSGIAFFSLDNLVVAHYLTSYETGLYGLMGLLGKMIFFTGSLIIGFILPITAYQEGKGVSPHKAFNRLVLLNTGLASLAWIAVGVVIPLVSPVFFGDKINAIRNLLPIYTLGILFYTVSQAIVQFRLARNQYLFPATSFAIALLQVMLLAFFHSSLIQVSWIMFISGLLNLVILTIFHLQYTKIRAPYKNIRDFIDLFFSNIFPKKTNHESTSKKYRILIFNWRDTRHVWAGGAEAYIQGIASSLVKQGHSVTVFCGNDAHSPSKEVIDGVQIIRRGGFFTVYFWAFWYYIIQLRKHYDVIIDSENGIPFLTPLYINKPIYLLIHHVHQDIFRTQLVFPFSTIALFIEGILMPVLYQKQSIVTVSDSSKREIINLGLGEEETIKIIHPGINLSDFKQSKKSVNPSLVYIGRLKQYKNIDFAIRVFSEVVKTHPKATFNIAGSGESEKSLKELVTVLNLEKSVKFLGKITDEEKVKLIAKSWVAIQPSMIEGWGITVIEANACGTPVVASNVNGLKDSVQDTKTGFLVKLNDFSGFQDAISLLFTNNKLRKKLSKNSIEWAKNFTWDNSTQNLIYMIAANENEFSKDVTTKAAMQTYDENK